MPTPSQNQPTCGLRPPDLDLADLQGAIVAASKKRGLLKWLRVLMGVNPLDFFVGKNEEDYTVDVFFVNVSCLQVSARVWHQKFLWYDLGPFLAL